VRRKLMWTPAAAMVAALAVPTPAQAVPVTLTASCADGGYSGKFVLRYDTMAGLHHIVGGRGGSGPYIGDSGTMRVRVFYRQATTERVVHDSALSELPAGFNHVADIPDGTRVPADGTAYVRVAFTGGGYGCTAERQIR
jgi:hypothetical protein